MSWVHAPVDPVNSGRSMVHGELAVRRMVGARQSSAAQPRGLASACRDGRRRERRARRCRRFPHWRRGGNEVAVRWSMVTTANEVQCTGAPGHGCSSMMVEKVERRLGVLRGSEFQRWGNKSSRR
jgi:hypothetical protein